MQSPWDERGYDSMQLRPCQTLHGDEAMQSIRNLLLQEV